MSIIQQFTDPYSVGEAWLYDTFIAPAVTAQLGSVQDYITRIPKQARVLEVGCGGGQNAAKVLTMREDITWIGLDLAYSQIHRFRARTAAFQLRRHPVRASAMQLPFAAHSFDVVTSIASLKHWPDALVGLRECTRVLKEGGMLLVVEADRGCRLKAARTFVDSWRIPFFLKPLALMFFHTYVSGQSFDVLEARNLLQQLPLTKCEVKAMPQMPAFIMQGTKSKE